MPADPRPVASAADDEALTFESALTALQQITQRLEDGSAGLEGSLADFERGVRLLRLCYQLLETAEQKIEQLVSLSESGTAILAPFDATATAGQPAGKRRTTRRAPKSEPPAAGMPQLDFDEE